MKSITIISLFVLASLNAMAQKYVPTTNTLNKKVMFGYQGWHATPNDGSNNGVWRHWFGGRQPEAKNANFDLWPDMREYPADVLEATSMTYPDGSPAKLYSAYKYGAVDLHFKWMMEHDLDGVFQQRFVTDIKGRGGARHFNQVVRNVKQASEKYKRVYCIMYDISGAGPTWKQDLMKDWMFLVDSLQVTKGSSYLHHKGKPLLSIWGLGFDHTQFATVAQSDSLLDWFHKNAPKKYQATIMGGINDTWQTHTADWKAVYNKIDIISPWAVGRFGDDKGADKFRDRTVVPDKAYCDAHKIEYLPVIFPGFSWYNLRRTKSPFNQIPRRGGEFYWHQSYNVINAGVSMVYIAMYDEVDEGTAMYKAAPTAAERPANEKYLSLDQDGQSLPSDWYLQLAQGTSNVLRGKIKNTVTLPVGLKK
ncbi:glycoside hydrolase family 71/99-like protein [Mucilaginibacter antarcticus]|uniref:Glycoside hydrolase family 71/99-like protein n=1 Tax=Mucilaginibacter antarcticus TaxID=1855725 RepID=A0ABW5XPJ4_9SPHI